MALVLTVSKSGDVAVPIKDLSAQVRAVENIDKLAAETGFTGAQFKTERLKEALVNPGKFLDDKIKAMSDAKDRVADRYGKVYKSLSDTGYNPFEAERLAADLARAELSIENIKIARQFPEDIGATSIDKRVREIVSAGDATIH